MVEYKLPKLGVASSNLVARSIRGRLKVPFYKGLRKSAFSFITGGILVELLCMFDLELTFSYG